jgi:3'(2'), 5'-bisphosphate nucleotidase
MFRFASRRGATFVLVRTFVVATNASNVHLTTSSSWCGLMSTAAASDVPLVLRVLANAMSVSNRAAAIVRDVVATGDLEIVQKTGANDLQTKADRTAQDCIVNSLRATFPGLVVIGEEGEEHISPPDQIPEDWIVTDLHPDGLTLKTPEKLLGASIDQLTVWVDPLDGTKEFADGYLDHVTILIGIAVGNEAVAGVINQPFYVNESPKSVGRIVAGMVGAGAIGAGRHGPPRDERILTTTRSRVTGLVKECTRACNPTEV